MFFVCGLGVTRVLDIIGAQAARDHPEGATGMLGVTLLISLLAALVFAAFGKFAGRGRPWAFAIGIALYFLDMLLFVALKDFLAVGFHVFALAFMAQGLGSLGPLRRLAAEGPPAS